VYQQFHIDISNELRHVNSMQKVLTNDVEVTRQLLKDPCHSSAVCVYQGNGAVKCLSARDHGRVGNMIYYAAL